ncbi:Response regulator receiver domain-containing protein [Andreprevotia lacus DSM 23236]|jgi:CheY-like chemotaxis protein|uniref:Response regulator receiver domain-containing protein n=1 Tax=Andreprevotia lacus DSM 23236 TaxID=1121001 RepID=A0A1W1X6U5_9NEIS|nr:response regulator [Andreprevotia lacus]SMC19662.1 Response regulator receiver domain-containing protein [Andreprevotia lacus DSM 23236]
MTSPHILVVDDEEANRRIAQLLLEHAGYTVSQAASGGEALVMQSMQAFDLMLLDLSMPETSGFEVCAQILDQYPAKRPVLVAYTAHVLPAELSAVHAAGFDDVLIKPVSRSGLLECMQRWTGGASRG